MPAGVVAIAWGVGAGVGVGFPLPPHAVANRAINKSTIHFLKCTCITRQSPFNFLIDFEMGSHFATAHLFDTMCRLKREARSVTSEKGGMTPLLYHLANFARNVSGVSKEGCGKYP